MTERNDTPASDDCVLSLQALQRVLFEHPIAAQAAFAALVAEGRRYAETEEGAAWQRRLRESQLVRDGRVVWEVLTQNSFEENRDVLLPSVFVDALARAAAINGLEPFLSMVFEEKL